MYERKRLLPLRDAIILHLEPYSSRANPYIMPESTCQEAMSELLSASRGNLSRVMNELKEEGYLDEMRAHVPTGKLRRKTYVLTEVGMKEARHLRSQTGEREVKLKDEGGQIFNVKLGEIPREIRDGSSILDIALNVHMGVFDKEAYVENIKTKAPFVTIDEQMPRIYHFFGREKELRDISEWFESKKERILEIRGVPGIGKTALVATAFKDLRESTNALWLTLNEQTSLDSFLQEIAAFYKLLGKSELDVYLKTHDEKKLEEVLYILGKEWKEVETLITLDSCEKVRGNLAKFINMALDNASDYPHLKIILSGRTITRLRRLSEAKKRGLVRRIDLPKLDYQNARKILQLKGVPDWKQEEAYDRTKGLPFLLDLIGPTHELEAIDVKSYIEDEILSQMSPDERRVLGIVSIFHEPAHSDAFFQWKNMKHSIIRSLVEKSLLLEVSPMKYSTHDILRDFVSKELTARTRKMYHRKAASYYSELGDFEAVLWRASHLIAAGQESKAVGLLERDGHRIIAKGHTEALNEILKALEPDKRFPSSSGLAFLRGECLFILGSWDRAIDEYDRCQSLSEERGDLSRQSVCLQRLAEIRRRRGMDRKALKDLQRGAMISKSIDDLEGLAECYYQIAAILLMQRDDLGESQEYLHKCLETAETSGNTTEIAKAHTALGVLKEKMGEEKEGLRMKAKAVEYAKESGDLNLLNLCYNNLAVSYYNMKKNQRALENYEKALDSARQIGDVSSVAYGLSNMASVYIEKPNLTKAEECLDEAVEIFSALGEEKSIATAHLSYGFIYSKRGNWKKAEEHFDRNIEMTERVGSPSELFRSYKTIGQLVMDRNRKKGLDYLERASALADKIMEPKQRKNLKSRIEYALSKAEGAK